MRQNGMGKHGKPAAEDTPILAGPYIGPMLFWVFIGISLMMVLVLVVV